MEPARIMGLSRLVKMDIDRNNVNGLILRGKPEILKN
jgi:hypothetical protein